MNDETVRRVIAEGVRAGLLAVQGMEDKPPDEVATDILKAAVATGLAAIPGNIKIKLGGFEVPIPVDMLIELAKPAIYAALSALISKINLSPSSVEVSMDPGTVVTWEIED